MRDPISNIIVQKDLYSQEMPLEECEQKMGAFVYRFRRPTNVTPFESFVRFFSDILDGVTKAKDNLCNRERTLPDLIHIRGQKLQIARDSSSELIWGSISDDKKSTKPALKIAITFLPPSQEQLEVSKNGSQTNTLLAPPPPPPPPPPPQNNLAEKAAHASSGKNRSIQKMTGAEAVKQLNVVPGSGHNIDADTLKNRLNGLRKPDQSNRLKINSASSAESDLLKELAKKMASRNLSLNNAKLDETDTWDDKEPPPVKL